MLREIEDFIDNVNDTSRHFGLTTEFFLYSKVPTVRIYVNEEWANIGLCFYEAAGGGAMVEIMVGLDNKPQFSGARLDGTESQCMETLIHILGHAKEAEIIAQTDIEEDGRNDIRVLNELNIIRKDRGIDSFMLKNKHIRGYCQSLVCREYAKTFREDIHA